MKTAIFWYFVSEDGQTKCIPCSFKLQYLENESLLSKFCHFWQQKNFFIAKYSYFLGDYCWNQECNYFERKTEELNKKKRERNLHH